MGHFVLHILVCIGPFGPQLPQKTVWRPTRDIPLNGIAKQTYGHLAYMRLILMVKSSFLLGRRI